MDRRIEDRGRPHNDFDFKQVGGTPNRPVIEMAWSNRRSGQDRRKHDLLAEAKAMVGYRKVDIPKNVAELARSINDSHNAIGILITMMERRGK